jgi:hypothetical protein
VEKIEITQKKKEKEFHRYQTEEINKQATQ